MTSLNMPDTAEAAIDQLEGVGRLLTAKKWERAAIVAALVGPAPGSGGDRRSANREQSRVFDFGPELLAEQGITGLATKDSVMRYRDAWFSYTNQVPEFGKAIELPDASEWPTIDARSGGDQTVGGYRATRAETRERAQNDPDFVEDVHSHASPEAKRRAFQQLAADDDVRNDHETRNTARQGMYKNSTVERLRENGHRKQQEVDAAMQQHPMKQVQAQGYLSNAARQLGLAAGELETTRITDTEVADLMREHVDQIERKLDLVKMSLDGTSEAVEDAIAQLGETHGE